MEGKMDLEIFTIDKVEQMLLFLVVVLVVLA